MSISISMFSSQSIAEPVSARVAANRAFPPAPAGSSEPPDSGAGPSLSFLTRNSAVAVSGGLISQGLKFFVVIYVARKFAVADFGLLSFAFAVNALMSVISNFGLPVFGSRAVSKAGCVNRHLLAEICCLRALLALLGTALVLGVLALMPGVGRTEVLLVAIFGLSNAAQAGLLDWLFQGLHRQGVSAGLNIFWQAAWLLLTALGIRLHLGLVSVPGALCVSALLASGLGWGLRPIEAGNDNLRPTRKGELRQSVLRRSLFERCWQTLRLAAPLGRGTLLITVFIWVDIVIVRLFLGGDAAAVYAAGERPALALGLLLNFYLQGAVPSLNWASREGALAFRKCLQHAYNDAALLFVPGSIWSAFYAREILGDLFQRPEYQSAAPVFRIFQLMFPLVVVTYILGNAVLLPLHQDRIYQTVLLKTVGAFLVVCPVCTHRWGIAGAAYANLIGYLVAFSLFYFASRRFASPNHAQALLWPCIVGLATGCVSRMLHLSFYQGLLIFLSGSVGLLLSRQRGLQGLGSIQGVGLNTEV